jgi:delta(3,5)-delta(2,4)-dienoyl-CoA isomerase
VGLAADIGTLQRFPKITGNDSLARELALTGRKFNSKEAKEIGFISGIVQGGRGEVLGESQVSEQ